MTARATASLVQLRNAACRLRSALPGGSRRAGTPTTRCGRQPTCHCSPTTASASRRTAGRDASARAAEVAISVQFAFGAGARHASGSGRLRLRCRRRRSLNFRPPPVLTSRRCESWTRRPRLLPFPAGSSRSATSSGRPLPDGIRVSIEMDAESSYHAERLENPRRVFFDLKGARPSAALLDAPLKFPDDIVREIRLGRHPNATRIVMDMEGAESYSVFTLYDPFRLVVDFKRAASPPAAAAPPPAAAPLPALLPATRQTPAQDADSPLLPDAKPVPSRPISGAPFPALPSVNRDGKFSMARQLGLGISRIVIDAGHGGHDPGRDGERRLGIRAHAGRRAAAFQTAREPAGGRSRDDARARMSSSPSKNGRRSRIGKERTCFSRFTPTRAAIRRRTVSRRTS